MSPLADSIYDVLRPLAARSPRPRITYQDLIDQLPRGYRAMSPRSPELSEALGEIVILCRGLSLPALPAVVVTASDGRPGQGYYPMAHPEANNEDEQRQLWEQEVSRVPQVNYPTTLD